MAGADRESQQIGIGRLYEIAFGWLGMSRTEFETATLFEFNCRLRGWQEQQDRQERNEIENTRMLAKAVWLTVRWKGDRLPDVTRVFPMPWDPRPGAVELSEYDIALKVYKTKKAFGIKTKVNTDRQKAFDNYREQLESEFGKLK